MRESLERTWGGLPTDLQGDLSALAILLVVQVLVTLAFNRGYRRTERGPLFRIPLFLLAGSVLMVVRHVDDLTWRISIAVLLLVLAGFIGKRMHPRGIWMLVVSIAAGIGLGWMLSALVFALFLFILFILSPTPRR